MQVLFTGVLYMQSCCIMMDHIYADKSRTPSSRKARERQGTYTHACAFSVYILNLYSEDTCVVQVETGDTGFAADGDASVLA